MSYRRDQSGNRLDAVGGQSMICNFFALSDDGKRSKFLNSVHYDIKEDVMKGQI